MGTTGSSRTARRRWKWRSKKRARATSCCWPGKGHENTQILRDRTFEFDDREKARADPAPQRVFEAAASSNGTLRPKFRTPESLRLKLKPSPLETECGGRVVQVAEALGVPVPAGLDPMAGVAGVSIDSRTVQPGELFIAIRGPRHDGHGFVAGALAGGRCGRGGGARSASRNTRRKFAENSSLWTTRSTDCTGLATRACEIWRKAKPGRKIAGVAGSIGKTTTKEILAALVGARFRVLKTQGNLNNEYGLPLTLLGLSDEYDAAVIEMGMSHRGELARLAQIAQPDVGVITRVAVEHLEFFSSIDEIALAERELIENLAWPSATAVLNADDERVARFAEVARGPVIWFGASPRAEFRAEEIEERGVEGSAFDFVSPAGRARLELPLIGRHNVMNAVAALAAASVWGIGADEARRVFPVA